MITLNILLDHVRTKRDIFTRRTAVDDPLPSDVYIKSCVINCWTKLDSYFALVDDTPATYAAVVTVPKSKWVYFTHTWKDAIFWEDAFRPDQWIDNGRAALETLWSEYKNLPLDGVPIHGRRARSASPDDFDRATDMSEIYGDNDHDDELELWISKRPFALENDTLPVYWLRGLRQRSTYRLARMALDMAAIPAMSSDCERVFSQGKLLITGQRHSLKPDIIEATQCLRMWLIEDMKAARTWSGEGNWVTPSELYNYGEVEERSDLEGADTRNQW